MANHIGVAGGPLRELKWAGVTLRPAAGSNPKITIVGDRDYTANKSGNGDIYTEGETAVDTLEQDIKMTSKEHAAFVAQFKDGVARAGTATAADGTFYSLNCSIEGTVESDNQTITLTLAGVITAQIEG